LQSSVAFENSSLLVALDPCQGYFEDEKSFFFLNIKAAIYFSRAFKNYKAPGEASSFPGRTLPFLFFLLKGPFRISGSSPLAKSNPDSQPYSILCSAIKSLANR
jgi:hypothetical protein